MYYPYSSDYQHNRAKFEKGKETDGFKGWRKAQYAAQFGHCAWCYKSVAYKDMDVDHIVPLARSGHHHDLNNFDNLVLACHECNRDRKVDSTYNEVAYQKTLSKLTEQQKYDGYAPEKLYWKRPVWIGANKYSTTYHDYIPVDIPESERNVWTQESPLVRNYSLKVDNLEHIKTTVFNKVNDSSETIYKIIKGILIGLAVLFVLYAIGEISSYNSNKSSTKTQYCDEACQEAGYRKVQAEEDKKREQERQEEYEEAQRYWNCRNAGGSEFECG